MGRNVTWSFRVCLDQLVVLQRVIKPLYILQREVFKWSEVASKRTRSSDMTLNTLNPASDTFSLDVRHLGNTITGSDIKTVLEEILPHHWAQFVSTNGPPIFLMYHSPTPG
jgi:hypothetical protein